MKLHTPVWKYVVPYADSWMAASCTQQNIIISRKNIIIVFWKYLVDIRIRYKKYISGNLFSVFYILFKGGKDRFQILKTHVFSDMLINHILGYKEGLIYFWPSKFEAKVTTCSICFSVLLHIMLFSFALHRTLKFMWQQLEQVFSGKAASQGKYQYWRISCPAR